MVCQFPEIIMVIRMINLLLFTIQFYRTVDLIRTLNTVQKNQYHQEEGGTVPESSYSTILLSAKM